MDFGQYANNGAETPHVDERLNTPSSMNFNVPDINDGISNPEPNGFTTPSADELGTHGENNEEQPNGNANEHGNGDPNDHGDGDGGENENDHNENGASHEPSPIPPDQIELVVNDHGNQVTHFRVKRAMRFSKLFSAYATREGKDLQQLRFLYDGERLKEDSSPNQMEMENGDAIDCVMEQIGGAMSST